MRTITHLVPINSAPPRQKEVSDNLSYWDMEQKHYFHLFINVFKNILVIWCVYLLVDSAIAKNIDIFS